MKRSRRFLAGNLGFSVGKPRLQTGIFYKKIQNLNFKFKFNQFAR